METLRKDWVAAGENRDGDDFQPDMPELSCGEYLLAWLMELGPALGDERLTNQEIESWQRITGFRPSGWDCRALVRLSNDYLHEKQRAKKRDAKPPWQAPEAKPMVTSVQESLRALAKL